MQADTTTNYAFIFMHRRYIVPILTPSLNIQLKKVAHFVLRGDRSVVNSTHNHASKCKCPLTLEIKFSKEEKARQQVELVDLYHFTI
jgi:hypothetical protein